MDTETKVFIGGAIVVVLIGGYYIATHIKANANLGGFDLGGLVKGLGSLGSGEHSTDNGDTGGDSGGDDSGDEYGD